jgi:tetratricopeptide (TPR) repeat protein
MPPFLRLWGFIPLLLIPSAVAQPLDEVETLLMKRELSTARARLDELEPATNTSLLRRNVLQAYLDFTEGDAVAARALAAEVLKQCVADGEDCPGARAWAGFVLLLAQGDESPEERERIRAQAVELAARQPPTRKAFLGTRIRVREAQRILQQNALDDATQVLEQALAEAQQAEAPLVKALLQAEVVLILAQKSLHLARFSDAQEFAAKGLALLDGPTTSQGGRETKLGLLQVRLVAARLSWELPSRTDAEEILNLSAELPKETVGDIRLEALESLSLLQFSGDKPQWDEALKLVDEALQYATDASAKSRCLELKSQILQRAGHYAAALETAKSAQEQASQVTSPKLKAELTVRAQITASEAALALGDKEEALRQASAAQQDISGVEDPDSKASLSVAVTLQAAQVMSEQGNLRAVIALIDGTLKRIEEDTSSSTHALKQLRGLLKSRLQFWKGHHLRARRRYHAALKAFKAAGWTGAPAPGARLRVLSRGAPSEISRWVSEISLTLRNAREAEARADQCITTAGELGDPHQQAEVSARCHLQKAMALVQLSLKGEVQEAQAEFDHALGLLATLAPEVRARLEAEMHAEWVRALFNRRYASLAAEASLKVTKEMRALIPAHLELAALSLRENPGDGNWNHFLEGLHLRRLQCQVFSGSLRETCIQSLFDAISLALTFTARHLSDEERFLAVLEAERVLLESPPSASPWFLCRQQLSAQLASITLRRVKPQQLPEECKGLELTGNLDGDLQYVNEELFWESSATSNAREDLIQLKGQLGLRPKRVLIRYVRFMSDPLGPGWERRLSCRIRGVSHRGLRSPRRETVEGTRPTRAGGAPRERSSA